MTKAVTLANLASGEALTVDETNNRIGIASTAPSASVDVKQTILLDGNSGVVTATSFSGDGSSLTGVANTDFVVGTAITMVKTNFTDLNVSGSATVSGQLSVGGTINYEDVTNVDSVGVVTARIGLKVLAGGINAVGVITGTSFKGDGSALTGIAATDTIAAASLTVSGISTLSNTQLGIGKSINYNNVQKAFIQEHSVGVGTTTTTGRNAGLGTAQGTIIFNSTTKFLELYTGVQWVKVAGTKISNATGGSKDSSSRSGFAVHTFTGSGSFQVIDGTGDVEYVIYGGGAGGGGHAAGGGAGAGGVMSGTISALDPGTYTVTIGPGGGGGPTSQPATGTDGGNSSIAFPSPKGGTIIAYGGGGGGDASNGENGGCGGGGPGTGPDKDGGYGFNPTTPAPNLNPALAPLHPYPITQGYNGAKRQASPDNVGGGGGGTGGGSSPTNSITAISADGGPGTTFSITGSSVTKGGGGGAGAHAPGESGGEGGPGGGADGSPQGPNSQAPSAAANTASGGGGGGGTQGSNPSSGGDGGSGIIYLAYEV